MKENFRLDLATGERGSAEPDLADQTDIPVFVSVNKP